MMKRAELLDRLQAEFSNAAIEAEVARSSERKDRVTARFWPTEASAITPLGVVGRCHRRTYYSQQGVADEVPDLQTLGRFRVGNDLESWVRDLAVKADVYQDNNVKIAYTTPQNPSVTVSGEVDMVYKIDDEIVGGEIKTSYGYTFSNYVFHKPTVPGMPKIPHVMQVLLYLYYYKHVDTDLKINRFIITYIDRGSMQFVQHCIELTDDLYPVINGITLKGIASYENPIYNVPKMNSKKVHDKLGEFEFSLNSVFQRYCEIYEYHESGLLIPRDYDPLYTREVVADKFASGAISKSRYESYKAGKIPFLCDNECNWCPFRDRCMRDDGIIL